MKNSANLRHLKSCIVAGLLLIAYISLVQARAPGLQLERDLGEVRSGRSDWDSRPTMPGGESGGHPNDVYGWGIVDALAAIQGTLPGPDADNALEILQDLTEYSPRLFGSGTASDESI